MKKLSAIVIGLTIILLISGCGKSRTEVATDTQAMKSGITREIPKKTTPVEVPEDTTPASTSPPASNTTFEQTGVWRTESVQVEPYYVANPTKSAIQQFCEGKVQDAKHHTENGRDYIINFYDDLAHTPNYTQGYDPEDPNAEPYFVCTCNFDDQTYAIDIQYWKEIPE